jgi:hypothetical protein
LHPRLQGAFLVALTSPATYRLLRELGIVRGPWPVTWARAAVHAGADLLLFTSADNVRRAIRALVPLARRGLLDDAVRRVVRFRESLGLTAR